MKSLEFALILLVSGSAMSLRSEASGVTERRMSLVPHQNVAGVSQAKFVYERRQRIQRVLVTLDRVAAATLQLKTETAERLEPVVVDLAEQAVDLSSDKVITSDATDASLKKLEETVAHLVKTLNRIVEPEMTL